MDLDSFELNDILRGRRGRRLLADLGTANRRVVTVFGIWVLRVVGETDVSRWGARRGFVHV